MITLAASHVGIRDLGVSAVIASKAMIYNFLADNWESGHDLGNNVKFTAVQISVSMVEG